MHKDKLQKLDHTLILFRKIIRKSRKSLSNILPSAKSKKSTMRLIRKFQVRILFEYWLIKLFRAFDGNYYLISYPDVMASGTDPLLHFLLWGASERRNPSSTFDTSHYTEEAKLLGCGKCNPLAHFILYGRYRGLSPSPPILTQRITPGAVRSAAALASLRREMDGEAQDARPDTIYHRWPWLGDTTPASSPNEILDVVIVSHEASRTGAPICVLELARLLRKQPGCRPWIIAWAGGALLSEFADVAPTLHLDQLYAECGAKPLALETVLRSLTMVPSTRKLVILNTAVLAKMYPVSVGLGLATIPWIHEVWPSVVQHLGGRSTFEHFSGCREIVVPSHFTARSLASGSGFPKETFTTIHNFPRLIPNRTLEAQHASGSAMPIRSSPANKVVLACGTVGKRKGHDLFIRIAALCQRQGCGDAHFVWVGAIPEMEADAIAELKAQCPYPDKIQFCGLQADMGPFYAMADLFLLPSREDPFPLVNLEAMACGLPVIAFEGAGGAAECFVDGGGVAVPYLDIEAMAASTTALLTDDARRRTMGALAAATIRRHFTRDVFTEKWLAVIRRHSGWEPE